MNNITNSPQSQENSKVYDIEIFPNYLLISFYNPEAKTFEDFEDFGADAFQDVRPLSQYLKTLDTVIGFNNQAYDNPVIKTFLGAATIREAKRLSDEIIAREHGGKKEYLTKQDYDVLGILDRKAGLKLFEARLGLEKVLESSIPFDKDVTKEQTEKIKAYCHHDILATLELWQHKTTQDKLRAKTKVSEVYGQNLTSSSESEIASAVLSSEIKKAAGLDKFANMKEFCKPCFDFYGYEAINPGIAFETEPLQKALEAAKAFCFTKETFEGKRRFYYKLEIAGIQVNIAQGGLHSIGKRAIITSLNEGESIIDNDVSSYYPSVVLQEKIAPEGFETAFLELYAEILASRMAAKKAGDKWLSDCKKIILNSTYGKFGDKNSWLYNPKNMLKVTLNCQFRLLQLIEKIALANIEILQINTDGVMCYCKSQEERARLNEIVKAWEKLVAFEMETTQYIKLVMKDSNNYVAVKIDGKRKEKGIFISEPYLFGGGGYPLIVAKAVNAYFLDGIEPEQTITASGHKLQEFCLYAKRDKWEKNIPGIQEHVNRWFWAKGVENKLASKTAKATKTDDRNIKLANDITTVTWDDPDFARYIQEAKDTIDGLTAGKTAKKIREQKEKAARDAQKAEQKAARDAQKAEQKAARDAERAMQKAEKEERKVKTAQKKQVTFDFESDGLPEPQPVKPLSASFQYPPTAMLKSAIEDFKRLGIATIAEFYNQAGQPQACFAGYPTMCKNDTWAKSLEIVENRNCNLGIRPDENQVVIDVDTPETARALFPGIILPKTVINHHITNPEAIFKLEAKGHLIYKTPAWLEKESLWLEKNQKLAISNPKKSSGEKGTVIELIGGSHKITVAPSIHKSGQAYKLENREMFENLPELPREFWEKFKAVYERQHPVKTRSTKPPSSKERALIEEIKGQITIYDILEMCGVKAVKEGTFQYIQCPWHENDNTPSCQINPPESPHPPCYCYSCGVKQDQIAAYMAFKGVDFKTALKHLKTIAITKLQGEEAREKRVNAIPEETKDELPELIETGTKEEIKRVLAGLQERTAISLEGITGGGKSHLMLEGMVEKTLIGEKCILTCATVTNAETALARLKRIMHEQGVNVSYDLITAKHKKEVLLEDEDTELTAINYSKCYECVNGRYQIKENPAQLIITTLGYAGRKGHTESTYLLYHSLIENRFLYVDEADLFFDNLMKVSFALLNRYLLEAGNYKKMLKCPVSAKKGDCARCILGALLKQPDKKTHERRFYTEFPKEALDKFIARTDLGIASWDSLLDMQSYTEVNGTLYYKPLPSSDNLFAKHLEVNEGGSYIGFLHHLTSYLHNPHIRIEYPKDREKGIPVSPDAILNMEKNQKDQIQCPIMACLVPALCGVDLLPLMQCFGAVIHKTIGRGDSEHEIKIECQGVKGICFATATTQTMNEFFNILEQTTKANAWRVKRYMLNEIPFTFDVTLLKTIQHLSIDTVAKIILDVEKKSDYHIMAVAARKSESDDLATELRRVIPGKVEYFYNREYEIEYRTRRGKGAEKIKVYVTYARSSIARGEDFPEVIFLIVDCQQFLPFSAIAEIKAGMSKEEKMQKLIEDITRTITQIVGRILRSQLERVPGQTVRDTVRKIVVLHGLPEPLLGFTLPSEVTHSQQEIIGTFISPDPKEMVCSCSEAILDALAGKTPKNYHEIAKEKATEHAAKEGQDALSKNQRALLSEDELEKAREIVNAAKNAHRLETKFVELSAQVKEDAVKRLGWSEIYNKRTLKRYPQFIEQLKAVYENNFVTSD